MSNRPPESPEDECGPADSPPHDCLWRVTAFDPVTNRYNMLLGLVRAPRRDIALTIAVSKFGKYYRDIKIRGEPIPDRPDVDLD